MKASNFPQELLQVFLGHSAELSRQCVEPPLRKKPGYVRPLRVLTSCIPLHYYPAYTAGLNSCCLSFCLVCSSLSPSPFFSSLPFSLPFPFSLPLIATVPPSSPFPLYRSHYLSLLPCLHCSSPFFPPLLSSLLFSLLPFISCLHSDPLFTPKPSLQLLANYLVEECTRRYPQEKCSLCNETAFPEDPKVNTQPSPPMPSVPVSGLIPSPSPSSRASFPVPGTHSQSQALIPSPRPSFLVTGLIPSLRPHSQSQALILQESSIWEWGLSVLLCLHIAVYSSYTLMCVCVCGCGCDVCAGMHAMGITWSDNHDTTVTVVSWLSDHVIFLQDLITDNSHPKYIYRVYCGHLYHQDCLNTYMKTPPFTGGCG